MSLAVVATFAEPRRAEVKPPRRAIGRPVILAVAAGVASLSFLLKLWTLRGMLAVGQQPGPLDLAALGVLVLIVAVAMTPGRLRYLLIAAAFLGFAAYVLSLESGATCSCFGRWNTGRAVTAGADIALGVAAAYAFFREDRLTIAFAAAATLMVSVLAGSLAWTALGEQPLAHGTRSVLAAVGDAHASVASGRAEGFTLVWVYDPNCASCAATLPAMRAAAAEAHGPTMSFYLQSVGEVLHQEAVLESGLPSDEARRIAGILRAASVRPTPYALVFNNNMSPAGIIGSPVATRPVALLQRATDVVRDG